MRAEPALPTMSAHEVARRGAARVAEAAMPREIVGAAVVALALVRVPMAGGLVELRDARGRGCGICASESVAARTVQFFQR